MKEKDKLHKAADEYAMNTVTTSRKSSTILSNEKIKLDILLLNNTIKQKVKMNIPKISTDAANITFVKTSESQKCFCSFNIV